MISESAGDGRPGDGDDDRAEVFDLEHLGLVVADRRRGAGGGRWVDWHELAEHHATDSTGLRWATIELQRYSGMRPGEICSMRICDLDTSGKVWIYTPPQHKSAWRGHERTIYLGPKTQAVLKSWLRPELQEPLVQPQEAEVWHRE